MTPDRSLSIARARYQEVVQRRTLQYRLLENDNVTRLNLKLLMKLRQLMQQHYLSHSFSLLLLVLGFGLGLEKPGLSQIHNRTRLLADDSHQQHLNREHSVTSPLRPEPEVDAANQEHLHPAPDQHGIHHHGLLEIPDEQAVPQLTLVVTPDAMAGWNVQLQVENFEFAPERVNQGSSTDEGHAHLYVNGEKVGRLYSGWYHLESLPPGRHEVMASLNSNNHETLTHQGEAIADTVIIEVPEP